MKTVLIGGGSGLIGTRLSEMLTDKGYAVRHLSRSADKNARFPTYHWDAEKSEIDMDALKGADAVINLAGAGIADERWTASRKRAIIDSRVQTTQLLNKSWQSLEKKPKAFISAAAMGYYGDRGDDWMKESNMPGGGFLPVSCIAWEKSIKEAADTGVRTVWLRTGLVLSQKGGAMPKMTQPLAFGLNPYFGNGQQWYSWIHLDDMARMYIHALENEQMQGAYNASTPYPERNKDFAEKMAKALGKNALLIPTPGFALRLGLGEMADTVLGSTRMKVDKILESGFTFEYPDLISAVEKERVRGSIPKVDS